MISPHATRLISTLPIWLLLSCLSQKSASSRCHLLLARARTTPGHWCMAQLLRVPNRSSSKERSDRLTGPSIRTLNAAIFRLSVHFFSEDNQQWQHHSTVGSVRIPMRCRQEGQRPARDYHRCDVPWCLWAHCIPCRRQRKSSASCSGPWSGHPIWEVHDCQRLPEGSWL